MIKFLAMVASDTGISLGVLLTILGIIITVTIYALKELMVLSATLAVIKRDIEGLKRSREQDKLDFHEKVNRYMSDLNDELLELKAFKERVYPALYQIPELRQVLERRSNGK